MNNSNNFNVCEKCGTANPLIAKYCYQCGAHLKTPEDPIVCNNCNTVNSGSARYCKHCGNKLFRGSTVKICPRCNHTVNGDAYICERCGFEFVAMRPMVQNIPQLPQNAGGQTVENHKFNKKELRRQQSQPSQQTYYAPPQPQQVVYLPAAATQSATDMSQGRRSWGAESASSFAVSSGRVRVWGVIIMIFALAFLYAFVGYPDIMPKNLLGNKFLSYFSFGEGFMTAGEHLWFMFENISNMSLFRIGDWVLGVLAVLFIISAVAMFLFGLIKLCSGKGSKKASGWSMFIFALGIIVVGLLALITKVNVSFLNDAAVKLFGSAGEGGWTLWLSPAFFLLIYLFSFGTRQARR